MALRDHHLTFAASFLLAAALIAPFSPASAIRYGSLTVVAPGDPAPKEIGGVIVPLPEPVCLNAQSDLFLNAKVEEDGVEIGRGVFRASRDGIATVILSGDPAPAGGIFRTARASGVRFCNDVGAIAFEGLVDDASRGEFDAVYVISAGVVAEVAGRGDPVPGAAASLLEPTAPSINDAGEVVFGSSVASADSRAIRQGIFFASPANLSIVALEGEPAPGIEGGFYDALRLEAELNEGGEVAFQSDISGVTPPLSAIFVWSRDHVRVAARSTDEDPYSTERYEILVDFSLNDHGDVAFGARLERFDPSIWPRFWAFPSLAIDSDGVDVPVMLRTPNGFPSPYQDFFAEPGFRIDNRDQFALVAHYMHGDFRTRATRILLFVDADGSVAWVAPGRIGSYPPRPLPYLSLDDAGTFAYLGGNNFNLDECSDRIPGRPAGCGIFLAIPLPDQIEIDVKPGDTRNAIKLSSRGIIPVAILGSEGFDLDHIDVTSLMLGFRLARPVHRIGGHREDVNGDGFVDLVSHYRASQTTIKSGDSEVCLRFRVANAIYLSCDAVKIIDH